MRSVVVPRHAPRGPALAAVATLTAALLGWAPTPAHAAGFQELEMMVDSGSGGDAVRLDTTLFIPDTASADEPAAAIVIAHGYGGTKEQSRGQATKYARDGYVVVTYTARGFGQSTGEVSIDAPDYEVADARTLIDLLAERDDVLEDAPGDPRVGFFGGSYGGGLSLLVAGYDERVDAVNAARTWNSLVSALFPNFSGEPSADTPAANAVDADDNGVFKELWGQFFFQGGSLDPEGGGQGQNAPSGGCEDMRPEYCAAYEDVLRERALTDDMRALLEASSPASVIDRITAPTLLVQGEGDKLFSLAEADANARGIAANGTPVKLVWVSGGHGAPRPLPAEAAMLDQLSAEWFDFYLRDQGSEPDLSFQYTDITGQAPNGAIEGEAGSIDAYPGLTEGAANRLLVPLTGEAQEVEYPQGGSPAAYSALPPGVFPEGGNRQDPEEIDGQYAVFDSDALVDPLNVVGSPTVTLDVASTTGEAVLFGKLYDVGPDGEATLIQNLVAPVRLTDLASSLEDAEPSVVTLPGIAQTFDTGHQVRLVLASTDQGFATPQEGATYQIALSDGADAALSIPDVTGAPPPEFTEPAESGGGGLRLVLIAAAAAAVLTVLGVLVLLSRRRRTPTQW